MCFFLARGSIIVDFIMITFTFHVTTVINE
jgi:hypothetical protein